MARSRLLLGSFDLFNIGHLTQLNYVAADARRLTAVVISDEGIASITGSAPFLPAEERTAVIGQLRVVDHAVITGPDNRWALPEHDELFVDAALWDQLTDAGLDIRHAFAVEPTRLPTNAALLSALQAA